MRFSSMSKSLLYLFFSLFIGSTSCIIAPAPSPSHFSSLDPVQHACNSSWPFPDQRAEYHRCVATLRSLPETHNATLLDVAILCTKISLKDANATSQLLRELLAQTHDRTMNSSLSTCLRLYDDATRCFMDALHWIKGPRYLGAIAGLESGIQDLGECDDEFTGLGLPNPLNGRGDEIYNFARVGLFVTYENCRKTAKGYLDCIV